MMQDYSKLVEALRECSNWLKAVAASSQYAHDELMALDYGDKLRDAADALEAAEKRIAELEKQHGNQLTRNIMLTARLQKRGEWISVDDRLPKCETYCLAVYRNKFLGFDHQAIKYLYRTDEYWISEDGNRYLKQNITHWMPLPDEPKEGA